LPSPPDAKLIRSYHASHFAFLARALQESIKICVQIEREGFMCIQIMMPVSEGVDMGGHSGILEFKVRSRTGVVRLTS
jgi:cell cycle checkpoint protein